MTITGRRILVVSPYVPAPWFGAGTRVYELVRQLAMRHKVTVVCPAAPGEQGDVERLRTLGVEVHAVEARKPGRSVRRLDQMVSLLSPLPFHVHEHRNAGMQEAIATAMAAEAFDVVQLEGSQVCCFSFPGPASVVLDEHNIEYEVLQRMAAGERTRLRRFFSAIEQGKFRRLEQRWWRKVDGVAVTSDRELPVVRDHAPRTAAAVVPNAVDPGHFVPSEASTEPDSILFMGTLKYRPNIDAVTFLLDEVLPEVQRRRPDAVLTIVGDGEEADLDRFRQPGVVVTGRVPDVRPYLGQAAVTVVPIRIGGGTRLKVVEALAMAKAVVSTTLGCEGLAVRNGDHVLLADGAPGFAAAIVRLLAEPEECRRMGLAGRKLVVGHYSWASSCEVLERLYDSIDERNRTKGMTAT
ncbi:MAG: polysaccharide biosynthesis protein PslH [Actinomycetota bacterium]|nr:polysaccharide biosynthesis protein PslH [Actinomycetota bacterium]